MLLLLLACAAPSDDSAPVDTADTDTDTDSDSDTDTDTSDCGAGAITGTVEGGFSGDGEFLVLRADYGGWSDGCYGGRIDPPHEAVDGAFSWPAEFYVGAGSPEPRPIHAVGCATDTAITLSIVEDDGSVFWGPWTLAPDATVEDILTCD